MKRVSLCLILLVSLMASQTLRGGDVPYLTGRVNDHAQILSPETFNLLTDSLKAHELRTTNQVVILTIPTLEGENIEDYAYKVFNEWKLGQEDKDNGILIVVAPDDRRMRIEVGYGLEGTLTDLMAGRIIRNIMTPKFKNGDFDGGIADGALAVVAVLEGSALDEGVGMDDIDTSSLHSGFSSLEDTGLTIMERILIGGFIFGIIGLFTFMGLFTPGIGWFLFFFLIPFWAMFPIVVLGTKGAFIVFLIYLIGFPAAKLLIGRTKWYKKAKVDMRTKGSASIGGFTFGSGSGSSSSGSSSSGRSSGGFSGGGGSSGGGGASGGW